MLTAITTQVLSFAGDDLKLAVFLIDLLAKSLILVVLINYLEGSLGRFLTSTHKHLLWIGAILLIGLLPIASGIFGPLLENLFANSNLTLVTVLVQNGWTAPPIHLLEQSYGWAGILLIVYLLFLSYLLLKLVLSFFRVDRIQRTALYNTADDAAALLNTLRKRLGISRKVRLGSSACVPAPISFGLIRPKIILPDGCNSWDDSLLENVLIHELSHIKRLDWLTHIVVYLVASINWFNPFVWRSLSRLRLEAEYSCDNAVLKNGGSNKEFAKQILIIARRGLARERRSQVVQSSMTRSIMTQSIMAQSIVATSELSHRIDNILSKKSSSHGGGGFSILISLSLVAIAFSLISATTVFAVGDEDDYATENLRLVYAEQPVYPELAFERGIQGLNQFSFSVDANGRVDPSSIRIEFSQPPFVFDESSIQALMNFEFKPRKLRGKIIPTPGVRYSFQYNTRH